MSYEKFIRLQTNQIMGHLLRNPLWAGRVTERGPNIRVPHIPEIDFDTPANLTATQEMLDEIAELAKAKAVIENDTVMLLKLIRAGNIYVKVKDHSVGQLDLESVTNSDNSADLIIPEFGLKLLPFIVSRKLRDGVMGDLAEEFSTYAA